MKPRYINITHIRTLDLAYPELVFPTLIKMGIPHKKVKTTKTVKAENRIFAKTSYLNNFKLDTVIEYLELLKQKRINKGRANTEALDRMDAEIEQIKTLYKYPILNTTDDYKSIETVKDEYHSNRLKTIQKSRQAFIDKWNKTFNLW